MATQAGIGVLIGLGIGSGVTAFLMQRIIRRQDNALQQSLNRLNRMQEDHAQDLNAALEKMAADYEQQLADKIERYQDTHGEQLRELEAEYEARIAVLTNIDVRESSLQETNIPVNTDTAATPAVASSDAVAEVSQPAPDKAFIPIPDPWIDPGNDPPVASPEPEVNPELASEPRTESQPAPVVTTPASAPPKPASTSELTQKATELGKAAAINRKDAIRAVPKLANLLKDSDADVRLAAVTALQESGSIKAIPFLRQALRDTDGRVVAAASAALGRFKGTKKTAPKQAKISKKKRRR